MQQQELAALIDKTATLMEQFERRCNDIDQRQQHVSAELQALAQRVPAVIRQSADASLQALPGALLGKVQGGLEQPVAAYEQRLREAGALLADGSQAIAAQLQRMERLHRHLAWKTVGVALGSLSLLLAGGIWLSLHYRGVIRDNQVAAELLRAYNQADVTLCDGRLCANVDADGAAYGERRQYRRVESRR